MYNDTTATPGGEVNEREPEVKIKKLTKAQKLAAFNKENASKIAAARSACCVCSPTRAQMLLVEQADGKAPID